MRVVSLSSLAVFTVWVSLLRRMKAVSAGNPAADFLGALEVLRLWIAGVAIPPRIAPFPIVIAVVVAAMTLLLGRIFCGWICPIGAMAELSRAIGRSLPLPRIRVSDAVDRGLKSVKYVILFVVLWGTLFSGAYIWREVDPWLAWSSLFSGWEQGAARPWGYVALFVGVMGAGLLIERFWCRYFCPVGAALGILGWMAPLEVGNTGTCSGCGACGRVCPVQLDPGMGTVSGAECLVCGRCVDEARAGCRVRFRFAGREVRVLRAGIVALAVFLGGCFVAWEAETRANAEASPPLREFPKLSDARGGHITR